MRSLVIIPRIFIITLFFTSSLATTFRFCDKNADYEVKVHTVEITPNPVARGEAANFSLSASTGKPISGGKVNIDVAYFGWHIYSESDDLCTETSCPIPTGDFFLNHAEDLPGYTPPGSYSIKMKIVDENKKQLSCVEFDFNIGFRSSVATS